jgi:hypothetical protein
VRKGQTKHGKLFLRVKADAGIIIPKLQRCDTTCADIAKLYNTSPDTVRKAMIEAVGREKWEAITGRLMKNRSRWLKGRKSTQQPDEVVKERVDALRNDRTFMMCSACGWDSRDGCAKCGSTSFEECREPLGTAWHQEK